MRVGTITLVLRRNITSNGYYSWQLSEPWVFKESSTAKVTNLYPQWKSSVYTELSAKWALGFSSSITEPLHPFWCSAFGSRVRNFEVLPQFQGVNPQICHKILELTLNCSQEESQSKRGGSGFWKENLGIALMILRYKGGRLGVKKKNWRSSWNSARWLPHLPICCSEKIVRVFKNKAPRILDEKTSGTPL